MQGSQSSQSPAPSFPVDLGIVILNWNTRDLLRECLKTVFASIGLRFVGAEAGIDPARADEDKVTFTCRVLVVDNDSPDGSAEMVAREFPQAELLARAVNDGYPKGNNVGLRALGFGDTGAVPNAPRYALLLNPDTEVPPSALHDMTAWLDSRPEVGAAGPKLVLPDGTLDKAARRGFPTPLVSLYHFAGLGRLFPNSPRFARYNMSYLDPDQEAEVDSVVGAYMQVRQEAIARVGLLDERFFMYGEDLDWAFRIKAAGWTCVYHPQVVVKHVKRAASRQSARAQAEFWRAMLLFYRKHFRRTTPLPLHALIMAGLLLKGGRGLLAEVRRPAPAPTLS